MVPELDGVAAALCSDRVSSVAERVTSAPGEAAAASPCTVARSRPPSSVQSTSTKGRVPVGKVALPLKHWFAEKAKVPAMVPAWPRASLKVSSSRFPVTRPWTTR